GYRRLAFRPQAARFGPLEPRAAGYGSPRPPPSRTRVPAGRTPRAGGPRWHGPGSPTAHRRAPRSGRARGRAPPHSAAAPPRTTRWGDATFARRAPRGTAFLQRATGPHTAQHLDRLAVAAREHLSDRPTLQQRAHSYRIAVTGSRRDACTAGYSGASIATSRLAAMTESASSACIRTGRWSMK